jgi:hypothetical protein
MTFCDAFEGVCTYGGVNYDDRSDCLTSFDGYDSARQECVTDHVGFAGENTGENRALHCTHAAGAAPCD